MNEDDLTLATELTNDLETAEDEFVGYVGGLDAARSQNKIDATNQQLITPQHQLAAKQQEERAAKSQGFVQDNPLQFLQETGAAIVGGGADAIDSVGSFLDLSGDTLKTGLNKIMGVEDNKNNPFSKTLLSELPKCFFVF